LLAICVAASADAHQANISTARVEAMPQRFVAVELALKSSDVDQRCGTHASSGAPWRDEQGARRCRKPGLASAGDTARDGEVGAGVGRDRVHGRLPRYRQSRGAAKHVRVLQRTLKDTRNRFEASQVTATDVAQSETLLAAGEASLHAAESTLMTTRANYRRITSSKGSFPNRQHDFPVVLALAIGNDGPSCEARRVSIRSSIRSITMWRRDCFFFLSAGPPSSPTNRSHGATPLLGRINPSPRAAICRDRITPAAAHSVAPRQNRGRSSAVNTPPTKGGGFVLWLGSVRHTADSGHLEVHPVLAGLDFDVLHQTSSVTLPLLATQ
jgi:hypothetical protein